MTPQTATPYALPKYKSRLWQLAFARGAEGGQQRFVFSQEVLECLRLENVLGVKVGSIIRFQGEELGVFWLHSDYITGVRAVGEGCLPVAKVLISLEDNWEHAPNADPANLDNKLKELSGKKGSTRSGLTVLLTDVLGVACELASEKSK